MALRTSSSPCGRAHGEPDIDGTRPCWITLSAAPVAALEVATGKITADACYERHSNTEFLAFLRQVAKAHPRVKLHVVVDNYATPPGRAEVVDPIT